MVIAYIDSNFVLQLALEQEEALSAEAILKLVEQRTVELVFPALAIWEPFSTITFHGVERRRMFDTLGRQLKQFERSTTHQHVTTLLQSLLSVWLDIQKREMDALEAVVRRLLDIGTSIELDSASFQQAITYRNMYGLSIKDSIIYSSVITDLQRRSRAEAKCFISTNWKDFGDADIKSELFLYNCRYISHFSDGLAFMSSQISQ